MIEKTVMDYLAGALPVPVLLEMPENPPEKLILLEKTGSGDTNGLQSCTLAIQSYGKSLWDAMTLNYQVKAAMANLVQLPCIVKVALNSDYNFTDTTTHTHRYQAVYDLNYYERSV